MTPAGWERLPDGSARAGYGERGWPTFEASVSALAKEASSRTWTRHVWAGEENKSRLRAPPVHPEVFAATLARKTFTNGKSDCELVAKLYADTLDGAFGAAETLKYSFCGWGDEEAVQLAKALPLARRATRLEIWWNKGIGARGYSALADAIRAGAAPRLQTLKFNIEKKASIPLRKACEARGIEAKGAPGYKAAEE